MKIYKHHKLSKWMKKHELSDGDLIEAAKEVDAGLYDANLGGGLIKKRIGTAGRGKRKAVRSILAFQKAHRSIFIYAFGKNEKENITSREEEQLKKLGKIFLNFTELQIKKAVKVGELIEVK